jgi:Acetoacetate decarboxylase (ADC)
LLEHPLAPGPSSAIEKGPWHYGADYVSVYFRAAVPRLKELVPRPFEVADGLCVAYVCEIVSVGDSDPRMVATAPDRTLYQEASVGVKCRFGGREGVFYPVMWVNTEWSLLRGLVNGYQKRLADRISITKLHPLNPRLAPLGPGSEFAGFCVKGAGPVLSVGVKLTREGTASDLPSFGATFGRRVFPKTDASQGGVTEAVEILKSNQRVSDVWVGKESFKSSFDLGRTRVSLGATYRAGFTISGSRVLLAERNP